MNNVINNSFASNEIKEEEKFIYVKEDIAE